jgi:hypothetical protein
MSSRIEYSVNTSTSLVLAEPFSIVYLSNTEPNPERYITIRDYTGNTSTNSSIRVSTTFGVKFLDGRSHYTLTEPYGYLTVNAIDSNTWSLVNTFKLASQVARSVDVLNTISSQISTLYTNILSTNTLVTSSIGIGKGKPNFAIDINGIVNAQDILKNEEEFKLSGDIVVLRTSSLNIATDGLGGSPSTNLLIGGTSVYTYPPTGISYDSNQIILYSNLINVNSTLNISNTGQVGINTSSFTSSFMDIDGTVTTTKLSFPFEIPNQTNLNPTLPLRSLNYAFNKWIVSYDSANSGYSEPILTSMDGVIWESNVGYSNGFNVFYPWRPVSSSNALVFWAPNFTILTTSDGSNFTQSFIPDQMRVFYAPEPNVWIGYANPGAPAYPTFSTDGYDWIGTGTTTYSILYDLTYGPNAYGSNCFAAIGHEYFTNELGIFLTYDNGSNWSTPYPAPPNLNNLYDGDAKIVYNGSYYCVLSYNANSGNRWTSISSNLSNWTLSTQEISPVSFNLQWLNNKWFITTKEDAGNYYYTSTDGLVWTSNTVPALTVLRMIDYNDSNLFMAVGSGSVNYQLSQDGLNWYTPSNVSYLSTMVEANYPESTIMVNTSTIAKLSMLLNLSYSTFQNATVTDAVYVGTDSNTYEGQLTTNFLGVNTLSPSSNVYVDGTLGVTKKIIAEVAEFYNPIASTIAVNKANALFPLDISGSLHANSGYIISSLGINTSSPSYTVDVSGITNATDFFINGVNQLTESVFSSLTLSTLRVNGGNPSTVFYNSTFFEGNTFTQGMNTSTLQSRSLAPIQIESFVKIENTNESLPTAVARYDVTNYTTANGSNFPQSVSGSSWPNANLLQGTANVLTTSAPRYITVNSLPPNFPSQTGGLHIGTSNSFRTVEMWVRLTRYSGDGQYFFDFRSGADAFSLCSTNPSGAVNGSALIGTTYYRNTLPSQWNLSTNPVLFLSNAGWVQFVQTFPTTITDTPTLFTRFDGDTFAFVQGMPIQFADIAFYNEELSAKQITDLYNSKCARYSLPQILSIASNSVLSIDSLQIINNVSLYSTQSTSITMLPSSLVLNSSITIHQPQIVSLTDFIGFTRIQSLFTQSTLGIRNPNPFTLLDIQLPSTSGVFSNFPIVRGNARDSNTSSLLASINTWAALPGLPQSNTSAYAFYYRSGTSGNSNYKATPTSAAFFTGQHANLSVDSRITPATLSNTVGFIVSSADQGYYSILPDGTILENQDAIWITEALPKIKLTDTDQDPGVWGIITNHKNEEYNDNGTRQIDYQQPFSTDLIGRIRVNGSGEGAIWVTNMNGSLENGDYICSSLIPGHGRRQTDDRLHSYTVAKATMSCDFSLNQNQYTCQEFTYNNKTYRKAFIGCSYHCS